MKLVEKISRKFSKHEKQYDSNYEEPDARQKDLVAKIGKMQKVHRDNKSNYIPKVKKRNCIFHCAKVYAMLT